MSVRYAPRALRDIDDILAYVHKKNPQGANNVSLAIEHAINVSGLHPRTGTRTDEPDLYRRPLSKYRYTLFYRIRRDAEGIEIVRVVSGARVKHLGRVPDDV